MSVFFSIVIPHYKHLQYLEVCIDSVLSQASSNFELLVCDDASPDDSNKVVPKLFLRRPEICCRYIRHQKNLGYDGNLRYCINNANGDYVFFLGNDDALQNNDVLSELEFNIRKLGNPAVCVTSYTDYESGKLVRRAQRDAILGHSAGVAVRYFRMFSFFSGLIFNTRLAKRYDTNVWDGSIYYQFYLATKLIAENHEFASVKNSAVRYGITINGKKVDTAEINPAPEISFRRRYTGHSSLIRVMITTIQPYSQPQDLSKYISNIICQIYGVSYLQALCNYRIKENWSFAFGVARNMFPNRMFNECMPEEPSESLNHSPRLLRRHRFLIYGAYAGATIVGLFLPLVVWKNLNEQVGDLIRKFQQSPR